MRVLSLGMALPNASIENYNFLTAPSFFDYDALVVDPDSVTRVAREFVEDGTSLNAQDGRPVVNGSTTASGVSAADQLRRRAEETQRLLERGGTVVVIGRPNAVYHGVVGFEGCDRYFWLPAPEGSAWSPPLLRQAEGKTVRIRDEGHPLASVLRDFRQYCVYRAVFDERQGAMRDGARIIAVGGTDMPIGVQFGVMEGRVVFVPVFDLAMQSSRISLAEKLVTALTRMHGERSDAPPPSWTRALALPGLEQLEAELEEAGATAAAAAARLSETTEQVEALRAYRALLWAEGRQFDDAVRAALQALGFTITSGIEQPLAATSDDASIFIETESSKDEVTEWPYIRLQRRLEEHLLRRGSAPSGLVIANGFRGEAPDRRKPQCSQSLVNACGTYQYGLITSETLFAMAQRALGGASYEELESMRRRLVRARGLVERPAALGEAQEPESGSIF